MKNCIGIKRLLYMVALKNDFIPTAKPLNTFLAKTYQGKKGVKYAGPNDYSIDKYLKDTLTIRDGTGKKEVFLEAINISIYGNDLSKYVSSFDESPERVHGWDVWGDKIEDMIRDRDEKATRVRSFYSRNGNRHDDDVVTVETPENKTEPLPITRRILVAPDFDGIDPMDIQVHVRSSIPGPLKSHLLYHSPVAVGLWNNIKKSREYPLYSLCETTLNDLLKSREWKENCSDARLSFMLGAGSSSKDRSILPFLNTNPDGAMFVWIDASWAMLQKTVQDVDETRYSNVGFMAIMADFENPPMIKEIYEKSGIGTVPFDSRKLFFILGFTLSNLNQERFFGQYAQICKEGDLFVFPMQFIPVEAATDAKVLEKFKATLLSQYDFPDGHELAQAGLGNLPNFKIKQFNKPRINPAVLGESTRSISLQFSMHVCCEKNGRSYNITTAHSDRHYESDFRAFLGQHGFTVLHKTPEIDGVCCLLVERRRSTPQSPDMPRI